MARISRLVTGGMDQNAHIWHSDRTLRIWEAATGKLLSTLSEHSSEIIGLDVSRGGSRFISLSGDGAAIVWNLRLEHRSPEEIAKLIRCRSPYRIEQDQLVPVEPDYQDCSGALSVD
jgi:WD40 repeat protein